MLITRTPFKMLLSKNRITDDLISMRISWRYSGFNVCCGPRIQLGEQEAMEDLARHIIRASFSQERMPYVAEEAKVICQSKPCPRPRSGKGKEEKVFDALEWLAAVCSHAPNKGGADDTLLWLL